MDQKKIMEVFADQKFIEEILAMETPEEVRQALAERGVDLSVEEILSIRNRIVQMQEGCEEELSEEEILSVRDRMVRIQEASGGELSEEEMDDVAGGFVGLVLLIGGLFAASGAAVITDGCTGSRW